jgi:hypothetical protein
VRRAALRHGDADDQRGLYADLGDRAGPAPAEDFWPALITRVKRVHPTLLFIAEAYWDMEWMLQRHGFDYCYDKRLYDRLVHDSPAATRGHLLRGPATRVEQPLQAGERMTVRRHRTHVPMRRHLWTMFHVELSSRFGARAALEALPRRRPAVKPMKTPPPSGRRYSGSPDHRLDGRPSSRSGQGMPTPRPTGAQMSSTELPPTSKQLSYLRTLAGRGGQTFVTPRTRAQASEAIRRLKAVRATGFTFAELQAEQAAHEAHGDLAIFRPWEIAGRGSTATWSQRS